MPNNLPSKASFWGVGWEEIRVLLIVTRWFNGLPFVISGEERRIGTHTECSLEELFDSTSLKYRAHEQAHQRLLEVGILQEQYICRRKIDWAPSEEGLRAIRDCLSDIDTTRHIQPEWADEKAEGPLYGDPNELLYHRKGVEAAAKQLRWRAWADIPNPRSQSKPAESPLEWYPDDKKGDACHDLHLATVSHLNDWGVEVIVENNNADYLVNKWQRYATEDRNTWWVFDSRSTACRLFNELDKRGLFLLDGGRFSHPKNWSAKAINQKIWRSKKNHRGAEASDLVHTVTGILGAEDEKIQTLFKDYYQNNS